jgi:D-alanyl-D-alanine carboxypeptidase/D-alanyl-D-alanine-endopeptidase (penicillin-binding protein 4)
MGVEPAWLAFRDGSGMSRHNFVTPRAIVHVLAAMHRSGSAAAFRDALPIAGVDGTLRNRMRNTSAAGNVRAKTGTMDKVRSLSGFVTTADGRTLLFSLLCNNYVTPSAEVDRAAETLLAMLASSRMEQ